MSGVNIIALDSAADITADDQTGTSGPVVPMPEPVQIPPALRRFGDPDSLWIYRLPDGTAYGAIARWSTKSGKEIRPIVWDGNLHVSGGFGDNRPLLNAHLLTSSPLAPVLIVEGEKTLDGASKYLPEGWVCVTWSGGASAISKSDWSVLQGHACVLWPDNDEPGLRAASRIQVALGELNVATRVVDLPQWVPEKWDLADPVPGDISESITDILLRHVKEAIVVELPAGEVVPTGAEKIPTANDSPDEDIDLRYRPLGYKDQTYYVMPYAERQIHEYTYRELTSFQGCMEIVTDLGYWQDSFGDDKGRVDWNAAGSKIKNLCTAAGVFDPEKIRERGVWEDEGRVVLHTGSQLLVDGREVNPARLRSTFIYPRERDLIQGWGGLDNPAPDSYGRMIRDACNKARWESPIYGDLLAGWIATAVVCGGLPWRTHCWITGNQGSGKTTVVNDIAGACLGNLAIYPVGESTEAGIRQSVGNDAVPVVFDESESTKNKEERRQAVIQLMRQSSSESRGRIMKGSANHKAVSFTLRSAFLMSSIGVGLKEAADLTRTAVLTVRPLNALTSDQRAEQELQWKEFQAACARVPYDAPQRLLVRQVTNLKTLIKNIEVFKIVIASNLGNRRLGDQLGTLLAGCFSLIRTTEVDTRTCEKYLNNYDWTEFTSVKTQREDLALLYHLVGQQLRVDTVHGSQQRNIGELIEIAMHIVDDSKVDSILADATLKRHGIRVERESGGVWVGLQVPALNKLMQTSDYFEGWARVLARHPYARKSDGSVKFAGINSRALMLPKEEFFQSEG